MSRKNNGVGKKVQKNPFLLCLLVIVVTIALFVVSSLSTAIQEKIREKDNKKPVESTQATTQPEETLPENVINTGEIKQYADEIESVVAEREANRVAVRVTFDNETALLNAHFANTVAEINVVPMFYFYINSGATQVKCPGELRLLSDGMGVVYYLSNIDDLINAAGLTDDVTLNLDNVLINKFNVCLEHKTNDKVLKTIVGTNGTSVEQFNSLHGKKPVKVSNVAKGIKKVETTITDEFVWVDIYYTDVEAYTKLNNGLITNFLNFKLEKGGKFYDSDFLVTEYEGANMIRCKFDSYSMKALAKEMNMNKLTVKELFTKYKISVWSSDYETNTSLFTLN